MTTEKLRDSVRSIRGVASAEVSLGRDAEPLVRVWTDGTRPEVDVRSEVEAVRLSAMSDFDVEPDDPLDPSQDADVITVEAFPEWIPGRIDPAVEIASPTGRIASLAIKESFDRIEVWAADNAGHSGTAVVGDGDDGLNDAIAAAVAQLRGVAEPMNIRVDVRDIHGSEVVTALVELASGDRVVGASIATGGQPFILGRAIDAALSDAE
jgi:hypothetical protein